MLEIQEFRGDYQTEAGRMNSPLHGCRISVGANSFALAAFTLSLPAFQVQSIFLYGILINLF
jgi:hypothetical protein